MCALWAVKPRHKGHKENKLFTFDNEFSKVGDAGASGGLCDAAVEVLLWLLDVLQLKGHCEAVAAQVLDRTTWGHFTIVPLEKKKNMKTRYSPLTKHTLPSPYINTRWAMHFSEIKPFVIKLRYSAKTRLKLHLPNYLTKSINYSSYI